MDNLSQFQRERTMRAVRGANTTPELVVRRLLFSLGYRYRLHDRKLPGHPDIVFRPRRKVIFVHGCFWHRHDCPSGRKQPRSNEAYWRAKLERNKARDETSRLRLDELGWQSLVLWECQLKDMTSLRRRLLRFLGKPSVAGPEVFPPAK